MSVYPDAPGHRGCTADELAAALDMDRYSIQPRTSELKHKALIGDSGRRRKNASGKMAIVWVSIFLGTQSEMRG